MNLFTLPHDAPFLDTLAAAWLERADHDDPLAVARGMILLPTRRAARAMAEAFLRVSDGTALLLPRITAIGALDEAPLVLAGALDLPPAIDPAMRLALLARLILAMGGARGAPREADRAWALAAELAGLMDEAERAGIDLTARLPDAADPEFAAHWADTVAFLRIVTATWPQVLDELGQANPAARASALLTAQADAWERAPPAEPVWLAGTTAAIPAVARLAAVLARAPNGAVVLPGLDLDLPDAAWEALGPEHPQAGLRALLGRLDARRADVRPWPGARAGQLTRVGLLRTALLPGAALEAWRDPDAAKHAAAAPSLWRLDPADPREEALAIALILRDALERPGMRAALVTPDRALAARVAAELARFGVIADDSAGEPLAETPPAIFLRLLARAVTEALAPVPLLALLKHPLAAASLDPPVCRAATRALERAALRGPRPASGLSGLRRAIDRRPDGAPHAAFLARIEAALAPMLRMTAAPNPPAAVLDALIEAAEALAASDAETGAARLWADEEGAALAGFLALLRPAFAELPDQAPAVFPELLDTALGLAPAVRTRRALRGREGEEHPRVFIWGLLEARLQPAETVVLGGLAETVWPPATDPGPWLSRPMRRKIGLPAPEDAVGQAAHDFISAAAGAETVVLSCPRRRGGAPAVPARWLARLDALLAGHGAALPLHPAVGWARALDRPDGPPRPAAPPMPRPDPRLRPRRLSVTEVETWLRDPYAIHARHVLRLIPLEPLEQDIDSATFGTLVHEGLARFIGEHGAAWPPDAARRLAEALLAALAQAGARPALANWWTPRLVRIADFVASTEAARRAAGRMRGAWAEVVGEWVLDRPGGAFTLVGRADRIERWDHGFELLDYKTGLVPKPAELAAGLAPQLPLEAAMLQAGVFGPERTGIAAAAEYWKLSGGREPGKTQRFAEAMLAEAVSTSAAGLAALIDGYDDPARAYLSQPLAERAPRFPRYAQLARVAERAMAEE